jgi:hypothetical protein
MSGEVSSGLRSIGLIDLVPRITSSHRPSEVVALAIESVRSAAGRFVNTLVLDAAGCTVAWFEAHRHVTDIDPVIPGAFLPWCLMRSVEVAQQLGFSRVVVESDRATWTRLSGICRLARQIYPAVRVDYVAGNHSDSGRSGLVAIRSSA